MAGMATFTIVVSSMIMKKPVTRTTSTTHGLARASAIPNSQPVVCRIDSRHRRRTIDSILRFGSDRLLVPGDIPVAIELSALLSEMGDPLEAKTFMHRN